MAGLAFYQIQLGWMQPLKVKVQQKTHRNPLEIPKTAAAAMYITPTTLITPPTGRYTGYSTIEG